MKLVLLLLLSPTIAMGAPYFRVLDVSHPQPVAGALLDSGNLGNSEAASLLPLLTHSPKDGCALPAVVCEDWSPLALGASMNAGKVTLDVAPLANVLPWMQRAATAVLPEKWAAIKAMLAPPPGAPVTFSAGPVWQYRQITNKGYFKVFTGLALHF